MFTTADVSRPRLHAAVIALLAFALLAAPAAAARGVYRCSGSLDIPQTSEQTAGAASSVACLVNVERTSRGIPALTRDADLAQAARGHAADMAQHRYFAHVSPARQGLSDRLRKAGYGNPGDGWRRVRPSARAPASAPRPTPSSRSRWPTRSRVRSTRSTCTTR
jgi:hypothetical protein